MGEQAEVITPAMLKEEEQLEAAGLEKERQMLEKVRGGWGGRAPRAGGRAPLADSAAGGPGPAVVRLLGFQNKQTGEAGGVPGPRGIRGHLSSHAGGFFLITGV